MAGCLGEASQHCHNSPTDEYSSKPDPCSDPVQQQIAGYLEREIAKEKNSREEPVLLAANRQFLVHRQSGEPDVHTI